MQDLLSMGSWKVTCVAALAAEVVVTTGRERPPPPLCRSVVPLPSGGKLLLSDTELPYAGNLSGVVDCLVVTVCWGHGPPSTGLRSFRPTPARGDGLCWLEAAESMVPSAVRLLQGVVPACDRATVSNPPVSCTASHV